MGGRSGSGENEGREITEIKGGEVGEMMGLEGRVSRESEWR